MGLPQGNLRAKAAWRVLAGFGRATRSASRFVQPSSAEELSEIFRRAKDAGLNIALRGAGRSYGDAALNTDGLVVDLSAMSKVISWDPKAGVILAEGGLTVEGLWRRTLIDGYWPAVVPGTMFPTLAGCLSTNIHGKNNFNSGTFGEHVQDFHLLTPNGKTLVCSREENPDVFHAAIGGMGLLGAVTRVRLKLKRIESGYLRVHALTGGSLREVFNVFESRLDASDYAVGWVDCTSTGRALGRGNVHVANNLSAAEDTDSSKSLLPDAQTLPPRILGVPRSMLWRLMKPFTNDFGVRLVNAARYGVSSFKKDATYLESHVAFSFLLDYVPEWRLAYGPEGFIQYQVFLPKNVALTGFEDLIRFCQAERTPPYLAVLKRHRPDPFLLSHGLDGWSLAMDFRITQDNRARVWALAEKMTERVLAQGGRFYLAKDSVLKAGDLERAYGGARVAQFQAIRARLDPDGLLSSELSRRVLGK